MGALTDSLPKPLLDVDGQPIIARIVKSMAEVGCRTVRIVTGYLADRLEAETRRHGPPGVELTFHRQAAPPGTAQALLAVRDVVDEPFLLTWADVLLPPAAFARVLAAYGDDIDAVVAVNEVQDPTAGAAVYLDDQGMVETIVEKPPPGSSRSRFNNSGVFVLPPDAFAWAASEPLSERGEYELPSALSRWRAAGARLRAVAVTESWSHLGTPEELEQVRNRTTSLR